MNGVRNFMPQSRCTWLGLRFPILEPEMHTKIRQKGWNGDMVPLNQKTKTANKSQIPFKILDFTLNTANEA